MKGVFVGDIRKRHSPTDKFKIAIEAIKGEKTMAEISHHYGIHSVQVSKWKKQLIEGAPSIFSTRKSQNESHEQHISQLYEESGR